MENENTFQKFNNINVNKYVKTKMNLNYLSWADAWNLLKTTYPDASMKVYTRSVDTTEETVTTDEGVQKKVTSTSTQEIPYFTDGRTCYVMIGVTVKGVEYVEYYPIMDLRNNAVRLASVTMTDVNKAIQRGFVKACARHGLGLYIYAGEDLPDAERAAPVAISNSNTFTDVKNDVVNLATKLLNSKDQSVVQEASRYIKEMFPNVRLSQVTEDQLEKLITARQYLYTLQK